jgi:outer membrane receptor protein involved in Fe transport
MDSTNNIVQISRDFSGNYEPAVPENELNLSLVYTHPFGKKINTFAKVGYDFLSGMWVDDLNTDKTDSYNLLNASIGADMKFGHFKFSVSGGINNIFNTVYVEYTTTNSADKRFYNAGEPVNFSGILDIAYIF